MVLIARSSWFNKFWPNFVIFFLAKSMAQCSSHIFYLIWQKITSDGNLFFHFCFCVYICIWIITGRVQVVGMVFLISFHHLLGKTWRADIISASNAKYISFTFSQKYKWWDQLREKGLRIVIHHFFRKLITNIVN